MCVCGGGGGEVTWDDDFEGLQSNRFSTVKAKLDKKVLGWILKVIPRLVYCTDSPFS